MELLLRLMENHSCFIRSRPLCQLTIYLPMLWLVLLILIVAESAGTYGAWQDKFSEDAFVIRTPEVHNYHLQKLKSNPDDVSLYGVYHDCPYFQLPYFCNVTSFHPDLMHDNLEGVAPLILRLVIRNFHTRNTVSVSQLNQRLEAFEFGKNDSNSKPVKIPVTVVHGQTSLPGKASEK
jgi:hypothetical protein